MKNNSKQRLSKAGELRRKSALILALTFVMIWLAAIGASATVSGNVSDSDGLIGDTLTAAPDDGTVSNTPAGSGTATPAESVTRAPSQSESVTNDTTSDDDAGSIVGIIIAIVIIAAVVIIIIALIPKKN